MPSELAIRICPLLVNRSVCIVPYHTHAHMQHTNDKKPKIHRQLMSKILHHLWATPCNPAFNIGGCWRQRPARTKKNKTPRALIVINVKYGGCRGSSKGGAGFCSSTVGQQTLLSKTAGRFAGKSPRPMVAHARPRTAVNVAHACMPIAVQSCASNAW